MKCFLPRGLRTLEALIKRKLNIAVPSHLVVVVVAVGVEGTPCTFLQWVSG